MSQLDLALEAEVSARHVSFLETGRSRASREMVLRLARVLDLPLRHRNELLLAAGYAPAFGERPLEDPHLDSVRCGLELLLECHEPYPAFVVDRAWNILLANRAHCRLVDLLMAESQGGGSTSAGESRPNALRFVLSRRLRPLVANWEQVAGTLLARLDQEIRAAAEPADLVELRGEALADPAVRAAVMARPEDDDGGGLLVPLVLALPGVTLSWYTTIATFGSPLDVTLQETRIESLLPADEVTRRFAEDLARQPG